MKPRVYFSIAIITLLFITGCATTQNWTSEPETVNGQLAGVNVLISPVCTGYGCEYFLLDLKNTTEFDVEVDWNNTLYIRNGQTSGGFMYEGIVYSQRNGTRAADVIFPGNNLRKVIYPNNLVEYVSGQYGGWSHESMPEGQNGIYLTLNIDGEVYRERFITEISIIPPVTNQ